MHKLILLDIDGTIADRDSTEVYPAAITFFQTTPSKVAFITNQGGPACHDAGWEFSDKFPSLEMVEKRITEILMSLPDGRHYEVFACFAYQQKNEEIIVPDTSHRMPGNTLPFYSSIDVSWRKPNPGMILQAMKEYNASPEEVLMVGDRPEDKQAAHAAGVDFAWANEFFQVS